MTATSNAVDDIEETSPAPSVPLPASPPLDEYTSTPVSPDGNIDQHDEKDSEQPLEPAVTSTTVNGAAHDEPVADTTQEEQEANVISAPVPERPAERAEIIEIMETTAVTPGLSDGAAPPPPSKPVLSQGVPIASPTETEPRPSISQSLRPDTPTSTHRRSLTISRGHAVSTVLISSALETIAASKDAKRSAPLRESTANALEMLRAGQGGDRPRDIFEPLRLACETKNEKLMIASLDCISKLISYSFFADTTPSVLPSPPPSPHLTGRTSSRTSQSDSAPASLVDLVVHTITACHLETTPETVSLQIVKALLALVLSPTILVHHSSLLKAIRTVYNIFLLSADSTNQMVAQGGLTQMVHHVFSRCKVGVRRDSSTFHASNSRDGMPSSSISRSSQESVPHHVSPSMSSTSQSVNGDSEADSESVSHSESHESVPPQAAEAALDAAANPPATPNGNRPLHDRHMTDHTDDIGDDNHAGMTLNDLFIKDAYLVFRSMCRLSMNSLNTESERDLKSHAMRSKLLSLHIVLTLLNSHMPLFVDPSSIVYSNSTNEATPFVQAINQWLCLSLSRNAVSPVPQVFDLSVEIFWRVISGMRTKLKKEIEVLLHEIFIPILEMKTATLKQKAVILGMLSRLCQDPQALVEIYLNYDCDSEAADNIYEHIMNIISKIGTTPPSTAHKTTEPPSPAVQPTPKPQPTGPSLSTSITSVSGSMDSATLGLSESQLRRQALECLVTVLRSLVAWGTASGKTDEEGITSPHSHPGELDRQDSMTPDNSLDRLSSVGGSVEAFNRTQTPDITDDPGRFESAKQRKTTLLEGIKKFNFKPKRGIQFLIENGFIASKAPVDIAHFLLNTDGLNKTMIGEYLGEGDQENVDIMHAFVDSLSFDNLPFVEALRVFLQTFRLPGEAQKIDRFVLKFADCYIASNMQTPFANADAAYILAYSVILLNTDQHNPQIKRRMTKADFAKNNRGINDGANLPEEFLGEVFDEIASNEIRMKDEVEAAGPAPVGPGLANAIANVGRDLQKEAYVLQTNGMANKTEALFKTMMRTQRRSPRGVDQFFSASHFVHVKPMFEVAWIAFLAGLSGPLQETDDMEIVELCLDGFKSAIRIVCFFDLELERNAFVTTLAKFTFLNNLGEMKTKNMEAIKALLDVAVTDGNNLKGSWHEVLTCVSQLERMQLISGGVDVESGKKGKQRKLPTEELANESRSTHITVAADMVFSLSHFLSGTAIVDFVRALSDVSWEEIQSSGLSQHPRLFSLQKLVEISYYNMSRIRIEWSNLWDILGEHFNQVCCHNNPHVGFFALDSLRQLAMRFLEKEELPHFKFQKDFLKPFEHTMIHNPNPEIRDMVLQCLSQMIQARVQNMRSGWRTMFGVFQAASKVLTERIANSAFEIVTRLNRDHFGAIVHHGAFADLTVCITEFCKVSKYQKISLLAIAMLRGVIPVMLECPECGWSPEMTKSSMDDNMIKYWYPILFGFYDIIMNGEDLEVRRLALDSLFNTLKTYGKSFPVEFWDTVCQELIFPIFSVLKSTQDLSRFSTQEDQSVWLSSTMIQALRDVIDLYTFYFDILERLLDGLLDLLCVCICQENDTLSHIGTSCLQQLIENNVEKLSPARWERVTTTFLKLFKTTTPHQLFDDTLRTEVDSPSPEINEETNGATIIPAPLSPSTEQPRPSQSATDRRRVFKQIIVKCVLQLLLIETLNDLLRNDKIFAMIPPEMLLRLMGALSHSYQFARSFNEDKELRTGLWKVGFMKHLPNLLKQESSSAATLVHVLLRMYYDPRPGHQNAREDVTGRLMPLALDVIKDYNKLRPDTQGKNIIAWTPVIAEIVDGFCRFEDKDFVSYLQPTYALLCDLLSRDLAPEVRLSLKTYFLRVGYTHRIIDVLSS